MQQRHTDFCGNQLLSNWTCNPLNKREKDHVRYWKPSYLLSVSEGMVIGGEDATTNLLNQHHLS